MPQYWSYDLFYVLKYPIKEELKGLRLSVSFCSSQKCMGADDIVLTCPQGLIIFTMPFFSSHISFVHVIGKKVNFFQLKMSCLKGCCTKSKNSPAVSNGIDLGRGISYFPSWRETHK